MFVSVFWVLRGVAQAEGSEGSYGAKSVFRNRKQYCGSSHPICAQEPFRREFYGVGS